jgi:hypothetical protein
MNKQLKPLIGVSVAVLGLLAAFLAVEIRHVWNTAATTNTVSFSGEGKVSVEPDIAVISASVVTQATDSKSAQDDNSRKSKAVSDFLKKTGIADKDVKTSNYNITPQYKYPPSGGQPTITGYQVTQSYEIKVRDLAKVSAVLDGLVGAGANQVNNLGLQIENPDKVEAEARQQAIDNAKKKARVLEQQVGINLGRIVSFSENSNGIPPIMYSMKDMAAGMGGAGPTPEIPTGQNDIVIHVTITYQIR